MMACSLTSGYSCFEVTHHLPVKGLPKKGDKSFLPHCGNCLKVTWCHKPKHHNLNLHYINLKYQCMGQDRDSRFTRNVGNQL